MLLRRPVIIALLLCAGATSTMMFRRSTAIQASPAVSASMHGALQGGIGVLGGRRASVVRAGLFAMPQLSLADITSAPKSAFDDGFTLKAMPAALVLTPSRDDFRPLAEDDGPPGTPIRDATKKNAAGWPEVMRAGKGDRRPDRGIGENVAYMVPGDAHVLLPKAGARPMARLSRRLEPPESAEGLQQFQPTRLSSIVVTRLAERLSVAEAEIGGHDGAVPLDHSLAPAGGMSPAASRPDLASLTASTTRTDEALPVELAMADPAALQPALALASVQPVTTPDDAQSMPEIGSDEGLTEAQKKSRIAGLPGLDDGKARPLDLPPAAFTKAQICLATAIYFEARGESREGQVAVAQVIINRLRSPFYPKNICDVVYQGASAKRYGGCQFSFACDLVADKVTEKEPWDQALVLAERVMNAKDWIPEVGNATHYHANYVRPRWVRDMREKDKIGKHIFYRVKWWA